MACGRWEEELKEYSLCQRREANEMCPRPPLWVSFNGIVNPCLSEFEHSVSVLLALLFINIIYKMLTTGK